MDTENLVIEASLPPDPDDMNDERAEWAAFAVDQFGEITKMHSAGEPSETILGDLLTSLMHYCDRQGIDFKTKLLVAEVNYDAETAE